MRPSQPISARDGRFSSRHHVTSVVSPNVQIIAMPVPLSGSARWWASTGTSTSNSGVRTVRAEQRLVARVVGMGDDRDATGEQLRASRVDQQIAAAVAAMERDLVVRARHLAVFHLGLGDRGAVVDVLQRRRVLLVRLAAGQVAQERPLADALRALADRRVEERPVDGEAEPANQFLEHLLVVVRSPRGTARRSSAG